MRRVSVWLAAATVLGFLVASGCCTLECGSTILEMDTILELDLAERQGDAVLFSRMLIQFMEPTTEFMFPVKAGYQGLYAAFSNDGVGFISVSLNGQALSEVSESQEGAFQVQEGDKELYVVTYFAAAEQIEIELSYLLRRVVTFPMTHPFDMNKGLRNFNQYFSIIPDLGMCVEQLRVTTAIVFPPGETESNLQYRISMWPITTVVEQHLESEPGLIVVTKAYNADGLSPPIDAGVEVSQYVSLQLPPSFLANIYMPYWQRMEAMSRIASVILLLVEAALPFLGFVCVRMFAGPVASASGYSVGDVAKLLESSGVNAGDLSLLRGVGMTGHMARVKFLDAVTCGDVIVSEDNGELFAEAQTSVWRKVLGDKAIAVQEAITALSRPCNGTVLAADGVSRLRKANLLWISPSLGAFLAWTGWFVALAAFVFIRMDNRASAMIDYAATALPTLPVVDIVTSVGAVIFLAAMSASAGSSCRSTEGARLLARVDLAASQATGARCGDMRVLLAMAAVAQPSGFFLAEWAKAAASKLQLDEAKLLAVVNSM